MGELLCFKCQRPGHRSADCPTRTRGQAAHPPAEPSSPVIRNTIPQRRPAEQIADAHEWANKIRASEPERYGYQTCGDPADVIDSPVRRDQGLRPIHRCVLRQMAAAQLDERKAG